MDLNERTVTQPVKINIWRCINNDEKATNWFYIPFGLVFLWTYAYVYLNDLNGLYVIPNNCFLYNCRPGIIGYWLSDWSFPMCKWMYTQRGVHCPLLLESNNEIEMEKMTDGNWTKEKWKRKPNKRLKLTARTFLTTVAALPNPDCIWLRVGAAT